ncbi:hypothetical protein CESP606_10705 [Cereibacter sphaeroides]|jgi:hypothetical protein|nr:hypothetical protein [Cereibacter sphaeroides]
MALPIIGADERIEQVIEPGSILCPRGCGEMHRVPNLTLLK